MEYRDRLRCPQALQVVEEKDAPLPVHCHDLFLAHVPTVGYISDYKIDTITSSNPSAEILWDETSYSNIMILLMSDPFSKCIEEENDHQVAADNE